MENFFGFELQDAESVLAAIKKDDCKAFGALTDGGRYFSLCFGRLPVLSLCYLYSARKILFKYENELLGETEFVFVQEDEESYQTFKRTAGRALRLYLDEKAVVTPLEMLAILGRDFHLGILLERGYGDEDVREKISTLYSLSRAQTATLDGNRLKVARLPMSRNKKRFWIAAVAMCVTFIILSGLFYAYSVALPTGSEEHPYLIDLKTAYGVGMSENAHLRLTENLKIDGKIDRFDGVLDGDGHTIYLSKLDGAYISTLTGTIKNLNVEISNCNVSASEDIALFVAKNEGTLENVRFSFKDCALTVPARELADGETSPSRYLSLAVGTNIGTLKACTVEAQNLTIVGTTGVNASFGLLTARNGGLIDGCTSTENTVVTTDTVDAGGLVGENALGGVLQNSTNYASITQNSSSSSWSPTTGGLVCINDGTIEFCYNRGAVLSSTTAESAVDVYAGGIAAKNNTLIANCKNFGDVTGRATAAFVFAGGIAGMSSGNTAAIQYSGVECNVSASDGGSTYFKLAGGITGYNDGVIAYCYSTATISAGIDDTTLNGGLSGAVGYNSYYYTGVNFAIYYYANAYLSSDSIGVASFYLVSVQQGDGTTVTQAKEILDYFVATPFETVEAIKATEVYWE